MRRRALLPAAALAAATLLLAGCSDDPTTISAPVTATGSPAATTPAPAATTAAAAAASTSAAAPATTARAGAGTTGAARPAPATTAAGPAAVTWTRQDLRLPDGTVAHLNVPADWGPASTSTVGGRARQEWFTEDGWRMLRVEHGRATGARPQDTVRDAALLPWRNEAGFVLTGTTQPMTVADTSVHGGAEFTLDSPHGRLQIRTATFAVGGSVVVVSASAPATPAGTPNGLWDLAQKAGDVRFTAPGA